MLSRLLGSDRSREAAPPSAPGATAARSLPADRERAIPPAAERVDRGRREVAQTAVELRERYPLPACQRALVERLVVRLAVDLEVAIRQPTAAAREAFAVASDPECEMPALIGVVERDPTLARALLRHAGSAAHWSATRSKARCAAAA